MKYEELYQIIRPLVAAPLERSGFRQLKSIPPNWTKPQGKEFLMFSIFGSRTSAWLPMRGGRFFARFSRSKTEYSDSSKTFGLVRFLSDEDLVEMRRLENAVLDELIAQKSDDPLVERTLSALRESWKLDERFPCRRNADFGFVFHAPHDVEAWGKFIAEKLHEAVRQLEQRPDSLIQEFAQTETEQPNSSRT